MLQAMLRRLKILDEWNRNRLFEKYYLGQDRIAVWKAIRSLQLKVAVLEKDYYKTKKE